MKNKGIVLFLILLAIVIVTVIVLDFNASKPDQQPANPYALNVDHLTEVDTTLIKYRESRNLDLNFSELTGVCCNDNQILIVGDQKLQIIQPNGQLLKEVSFDKTPTCVTASSKNIFVGFRQSIALLSQDGSTITEWNNFSDSTVITSIAEQNGTLFVADAGKRIVSLLNLAGQREGTIEGKADDQQKHGFIVPSSHFDLAFNPDGELWVVNPGRHTLENYTINGELRTWWQAPVDPVKGFSGCCNPTNIAFLPDGSFVTSEKGIVRIKTYLPSGEFSGVVAAPSKFSGEQSPDLAIDDKGNIYALDPVRKNLRVFIKK